MKFKVSVEKRMYATGNVTVDCDNLDQAVKLVQNQIDNGVLTPDSIDWSDNEYETDTFATTGDVD